PIGIILRSPDDDRMLYKYEFEFVPGKGLAVYDAYFTSMSQTGVNFVRVWMGAWWTALEWTHGYRTDYAGLGRYSQLNAWRMDHVMQHAERCGIYIDLTLHNHGQFRASDFDSEWYDNPYFKGFGGPVDQPEDYWTNEEARKWLRKRFRYMAARWSSSPAIGWWELCNEVDLVGNYDSSRITSWHRDMGRSLKEIDPYRHIVAAHYTGSRLDPSVQTLPENEVAQQTAYNADMPARLVEMFNDHHVFGKPVYVNEFGVGGSHNELLYNLHSGLWVSAVIPLCGSALFWWWPWVHEMNEYPQYTSVARFIKGEDWRGKGYQLTTVLPTERSRIIETRAMQSEESARIWIYDQRIYRSISDLRRMRAPVVRPCPAATLIVDGLKAGDYKVELWDTWKGEVTGTRVVHHGGGPFYLATPAFERDIACKIDRVNVK
ncbi:MAG: cellulase family glycosylhydrolase, partial [Candidatus Sumerlaeota bacterium]|nr:cellulase family glycosylhydrolase [Candidatus Sumerlaeota bacterium]